MDSALYDLDISDEPAESLPFEVKPEQKNWTFAPHYYPDRFPQTKEKELNRSGHQCSGEDISVKTVKNEEFHISGIILSSEVGKFKSVRDFSGKVNLYSPLNPTGGVECMVKSGEVDANPSGFDALQQEWQFEYTLDLVSTGTDEYSRGRNAIVTAITNGSSGGKGGGSSPFQDPTQPFKP